MILNLKKRLRSLQKNNIKQSHYSEMRLLFNCLIIKNQRLQILEVILKMNDMES